jgi:hypothetical protein
VSLPRAGHRLSQDCRLWVIHVGLTMSESLPLCPPIADLAERLFDVGKVANSGSSDAHSMTSSARIMIVGGTVKFEALAVLRLTIGSNLVGCSTGMSAGFAPLRMRSTISAPRRPW